MNNDKVILICGGADDYFKVHVYVVEEETDGKV